MTEKKINPLNSTLLYKNYFRCRNCKAIIDKDQKKDSISKCCESPVLIKIGSDYNNETTFDLGCVNCGFEMESTVLTFIENKCCKKPEPKLFEDQSSNLSKIIASELDKRELAKKIIEKYPIHYDVNKLWWYWDKGLFCWTMTDETNIFNAISEISTANTINALARYELLEALRQVSRKKKPKDIKKTWIQFQDEIFDLKTGLQFPSTPDYFVTNPIPYKLSKEKYMETPVMDQIFEEWVGKENVKLLHEIIAYCMLPDYPIHRIFCLIGSGLNGKTKFLELLTKFIGKRNVCSTDLDLLITNRFEKSKLYKKLVCQMGETNFNKLSKTSLLKKLSGQDLIGFDIKHKSEFDDYSYATIIIATNNLPETTDKSDGFYRRWHIVDFPNRFSEKIDILATIPEEEYECLALKSANILSDLLKDRKFTNEGEIEERMKRYEQKSNPIENFIKDNCLTDDLDAHVWTWEFIERFKVWCGENNYRKFSDRSISLKLTELGYEKDKKWNNEFERKQWRCFHGLKWKSESKKDA